MNEPIEKDSYWKGSTTPEYMRRRAEVLKLSSRVDEMVRKRFALVRKLVIHSYYEVDFLESALSRAVLTYEMALRRRYRQLHGNDPQDLRAPVPGEPENLYNLIGEAHTRGLLGTAEGPAQAFRDVRNWIAHPETRGGLGFRSWRLLLRVAEHVEGLYENPRHRRTRNQEMARLNGRLEHLAKTGAALSGEALARAKRDGVTRFRALANPVARRRYEVGLLKSREEFLQDIEVEVEEAEGSLGRKAERKAGASRVTYDPATPERWVIADAEALYTEQGGEGESTFYIGLVPAYPPEARLEDGPVVFPHLMVCAGWEGLGDGSLKFETRSGNSLVLDRTLSQKERELHKGGRRGQAPRGKITLGGIRSDIEGSDSSVPSFSLESTFLIA